MKKFIAVAASLAIALASTPVLAYGKGKPKGSTSPTGIVTSNPTASVKFDSKIVGVNSNSNSAGASANNFNFGGSSGGKKGGWGW